MTAPLLEVDHLKIEFPTRRGTLTAINDVSFSISAGEVLGVVGESGAGKSLTGAAIIGLLEPPLRIASGEIRFDGQRIDNLPPEKMRRIRGKSIGAIFQDPLTSLNPLYTVGRQLIETIRVHLPMDEKAARKRAIELLQEVGIPAAAQRLDSYPHQFSGGMRQRVVIALAIAANPRLIIADEPTTALDVSIQAQIIALLKRLCRDHGTAVMLVTHDMGVIAETADRVAVMYAGRVAEIGPVRDVIKAPQHPYTIGLMGSIPTIGHDLERLRQIDGAMPRLTAIPKGCAFNPRCPSVFDRCREERPSLMPAGTTQAACWLHDATNTDRTSTLGAVVAALTPKPAAAPPKAPAEKGPPVPVLQATDLTRHFDISPPLLARLLEGKKRLVLKAVDGIDFEIEPGTTFSLVGESGCGKSTVARLVVGLYPPSAGRVEVEGVDLARLRTREEQSPFRRRVQMIFQDPYASLNPRWRVRDIIAEPIRTHGLLKDESAIRDRVGELLTQVNLSPADGEKYPHEFSGGQRQRVSIARALASNPEFLVCDEPTSALDVSVQAQILNLMKDLQRRLGLTYLFISHNLAVIAHVSDRIGVMYLGRLVEVADSRELFARPRHPYTRLLLDTIPDLDMRGAERQPVAGEVPNPINPPSGCAFHPRCPYANERCKTERPFLLSDAKTLVACHAVEEGRLPEAQRAFA